MFSLLRTLGAVSGRRAFSTSPPVANNFAKIALLGRLASEPEISTGPSGVEMIRYTVGVSQGKEKPTSWYKVVSFAPDSRGKEYLMALPKGALVHVEGDANMRPYESEGGGKHLSFGVIQRTILTVLRPRPKEEGEE